MNANQKIDLSTVFHQYENSKDDNFDMRFYRDMVWFAHFHKNFELIYCVEGEIKVNRFGVETILHPGEVLIVPPNTTHGFDIPKTSGAWVVVFSDNYVRNFASKHSKDIYSAFTLSADVSGFLNKKFFNLDETSFYTKSGCLNIICDECLNLAIREDRPRDADKINEIVAFIANNYKNEVNMKDVAALLGYEYHYFSKVFHDNFTSGFAEFVNRYRYETACKLLKTEGMSVTKASEESGFSSVRNFNRVFKKYSGMSPAEYKNKEI